jgi:hypothetical protein
MVKSYETLVDSNAGVDVNTGMVAAGRLQSLIDSRDYSRDIAELRFQVGQISEAVRSVSRSRCGRRSSSSWSSWSSSRRRSTSGEDGFDDDDAYDPIEFIDEDDEF